MKWLMNKAQPTDQVEKHPNIRFEKKLGLIIFLFFLLGFILWGSFAQIESAAIAPGKITVSGMDRVVEHYDGGIVDAILVKDGAFVQKNQPVIILEKTQAEVASLINEHTYYNLLATEARLTSELKNQATVNYPEEIIKRAPLPQMQKIMNLQNSIIKSNNDTFKSSTEIYRQRIEQLEDQLQGAQAQLQSIKTQLSFINRELINKRKLEKERLITQSQLFALEREAAGLVGQEGQQQAQISIIKEKMGETQLELNTEENKRKKELLDNLYQTQQALAEVEQKYKAAKDKLVRTNILAPVSGTVANLKIHTIGEVVKPAEVLMNIVPNDETLDASVRINPLDIDVVHEGLKAKIRLSAYKQRTTPFIMGTVIHVAADALLDERTGHNYYDATIDIDPNQLAKLPHVKLYPGMPVEAMIITNKMSPFSYFISPIEHSFNRAFKEN